MSFGFIFTRVHILSLFFVNVSPNSHGAYRIYTNVAHFGGFGGAFGPYSYTCSTLAWELGTTTSINNDLATTDACAPSHPLPFQVLAMVDIDLVTQVVHMLGVVDRGPTSSTPQRSRKSHLCGRLHLKQCLKICDATSTISSGFHEMFMS